MGPEQLRERPCSHRTPTQRGGHLRLEEFKSTALRFWAFSSPSFKSSAQLHANESPFAGPPSLRAPVPERSLEKPQLPTPRMDRKTPLLTRNHVRDDEPAFPSAFSQCISSWVLAAGSDISCLMPWKCTTERRSGGHVSQRGETDCCRRCEPCEPPH